jgi:ribosomal subunit interface protein
MRLDITGRHVEITPALRQLITQRLTKLERLLDDADEREVAVVREAAEIVERVLRSG